jgi:hypothetical protein
MSTLTVLESLHCALNCSCSVLKPVVRNETNPQLILKVVNFKTYAKALKSNPESPSFSSLVKQAGAKRRQALQPSSRFLVAAGHARPPLGRFGQTSRGRPHMLGCPPVRPRGLGVRNSGSVPLFGLIVAAFPTYPAMENEVVRWMCLNYQDSFED